MASVVVLSFKVLLTSGAIKLRAVNVYHCIRILVFSLKHRFMHNSAVMAMSGQIVVCDLAYTAIIVRVMRIREDGVGMFFALVLTSFGIFMLCECSMWTQ